MERNIADIMTMGWTEEEIRTFSSEEQKELARTARRLQKSAWEQHKKRAQTQPLAMTATAGAK